MNKLIIENFHQGVERGVFDVVTGRRVDMMEASYEIGELITREAGERRHGCP